ncbi:flavoprotein [Oceanobacillus sp. J11TS1]|uniref:flavoprotein n=1 Tax=Oceanobacillus sp. J11TS1 TaxID=2807191 RepID=UPI001B24702E|nr:flavoprotein [Oceanobacillus sp. J11TS1]GIO22994.1 hypothetical protein J11TS1_15750 [Oceanobacillus sp. J11TS1]
MDFSIFKNKKLLIGMSGAISAAGISSYLLYFNNYFKEIRVVMTPTAEEIIPASTISYFGYQVYTENGDKEIKHNHMTIGRWADAYCIIPATANIVGQIANGLAMNLLTTTVLAHSHSTILFPTMNESMWQKNITSRNIEQIRKDGHIVVDPVEILAYEVSSGTRKTNRAMVSPDKALIKIGEVIQKREGNL